MQLYSGLSKLFIRDAKRGRLAPLLQERFVDAYGYGAPKGEVRSWAESLATVAVALEESRMYDVGVICEYQLPLTSRRVDCVLCGKDENGEDTALLIELKQWDRCNETGSENVVEAFVGGANRWVLHPSVQARQYMQYLSDTLTTFHQEPNAVRLTACAYAHNYVNRRDEPLLSERFEDVLKVVPCFTKRDVDEEFSRHLQRCVGHGAGEEVLKRVLNGEYAASKKLMEHVANIIRHRSDFVLIDEQLIVFDTVLEQARSILDDSSKSMILIRGGPGTGKSVIAINLMSELLSLGFDAHYATGSKAFTETLRNKIGTRGAAQFKYFNSYMRASEDDVDVLICDEAHRIRESSNQRFTKRERRTDKSQIDELVDVSRLSIFFIDDKQIVRPNEIGSAELIRSAAKNRGLPLREFDLLAQFRCAGSEGFVNWVTNTLGIELTANATYGAEDDFDFQIFDSPQSLDAAILEKAGEGYSARLTAGFCWPWSDPNADGTLADDVVIGAFCRPWNAKPEAGRLAPDIPKAALWANHPGGMSQIGCVYTAQGFEFDYVGVIFGLDLRYDLMARKWIGDKQKCHDSVVKRSKDKFESLLKNTYRILLTRGLKGCYVHFMDHDTEQFFRDRMSCSTESQ
jgi:hypothetical protein